MDQQNERGGGGGLGKTQELRVREKTKKNSCLNNITLKQCNLGSGKNREYLFKYRFVITIVAGFHLQSFEYYFNDSLGTHYLSGLSGSLSPQTIKKVDRKT